MTFNVPALHVAGYDVLELDDIKSESYFGKTPPWSYIGLCYIIRDEEGKEIARSAVFAQWPDKPENQIKRQRVRIIADAICRYKNLGGGDLEPWGYNDFALNDMLSVADNMAKFNIPDDWELWCIDEEEHTFKHKTANKFLRVVEGQFTELLDDKGVIELELGIRPEIIKEGPVTLDEVKVEPTS